MNKELLSVVINSGVQITLRGSVAYCIQQNEAYSRVNDVDILFSSHGDLDEFIFRLRDRKLNIAPVEYLPTQNNIPRKRLCISSNSSGSLIIDALIYDQYFPDATPISADLSTTFLPTSEELLAENLLSISNTAVGMRLSNWRAKGKRILRRVCRLYRTTASWKVHRCLICVPNFLGLPRAMRWRNRPVRGAPVAWAFVARNRCRGQLPSRACGCESAAAAQAP